MTNPQFPDPMGMREVARPGATASKAGPDLLQRVAALEQGALGRPGPEVSNGSVITSDTSQTGGVAWSAGDAWSTPALGSGWSHYSSDYTYGLVQYSRDPGGVVRLKGVAAHTAGAAASPFTLPAGYRPQHKLIVTVWTNTGARGATILPDGTFNFDTTVAATFMSFAFEFRAEAWSKVVADLAPVAWWRLGEANGTTAADEIGAYSGTINGNPTLGLAGAIATDADTAIDFDGTGDYVQIAYAAALNPSTFTVAGFLYRDTDTGAGEVMFSSRTATNGFDVRISSTDKLQITLGDGAATSGTAGATSIATGSWYAWAATYDGTNARVYLNGVADVAATADSYAANATNDATIAALNTTGTPSTGFSGKLDEVMLFNRALTQHEIYTLYGLRS